MATTRAVHVNAVRIGDELPRLGVVVYAAPVVEGAEHRTLMVDSDGSRLELDAPTDTKVLVSTRPRKRVARRTARPKLHVVR